MSKVNNRICTNSLESICTKYTNSMKFMLKWESHRCLIPKDIVVNEVALENCKENCE